MGLYTGLTTEQALAKWYDIRKRAGFYDQVNSGKPFVPNPGTTPEEIEDIGGGMIGLNKDNPQAFADYSHGSEINGDEDHFKEFNTTTGDWDTKEHHGFWSHPESWLQVGFGAGLGGVVAPALMAGNAGAMGGASGSAAAGGTLASTPISLPLASTGLASTAGADFSAAAAAGAAAGGAGGAASLAPLASGPLTDSAGGEVALNNGALTAGGTNPAVGGVGAAAGKAQIGQQIEDLMKKGKTASDAWDQISKSLGTYADTNVNNQRNLDRDRIAAQTARNSNESDALRKLMVTNYLTNQTHGYQPPTIGSFNGKQIKLPDMGAGFLAPSAAQKQAAGTLEPMLTQRLAPGGSVWPEGPTTADNIANAGSLITGGIGALSQADPNWMSQAGHFIKGIFS